LGLGLKKEGVVDKDCCRARDFVLGRYNLGICWDVVRWPGLEICA